jgi:hypothetical protein
MKLAEVAVMRFEDRPGPQLNRFRLKAAWSIKGADHLAPWSGLSRSIPSSAEICTGSMAPCGEVTFNLRVGERLQSVARF